MRLKRILPYLIHRRPPWPRQPLYLHHRRKGGSNLIPRLPILAPNPGSTTFPTTHLIPRGRRATGVLRPDQTTGLVAHQHLRETGFPSTSKRTLTRILPRSRRRSIKGLTSMKFPCSGIGFKKFLVGVIPMSICKAGYVSG